MNITPSFFLEKMLPEPIFPTNANLYWYIFSTTLPIKAFINFDELTMKPWPYGTYLFNIINPIYLGRPLFKIHVPYCSC